MTTPAPRYRTLRSKDVDCPTCGSTAGESCRGSAYSGRGNRNVQSHHRRVEAARAASVSHAHQPEIAEADRMCGDGFVRTFWRSGCACGWVGTFCFWRSDAETAGDLHAADANANERQS